MFKKGNVFDGKSRNGWFYGYFMEDGLSKDDRAEVKVTKVDKSFTSSYHYNKTATKIDIIWEGEAIWEVEGEEIQLEKGDYLIIPPKTRARVKKVLSDNLIVQTIKIPSVPNDKVEE